MNNAIRSNEFVTDTMGLVLWLERRKFNPKVRAIYESAESGKAVIYIPAMVFAEILYLSEKHRISITLDQLSIYLKRCPHYRESAADLMTIQSAAQIIDIPELHDRLIAGTARRLGLALITNDPVIQASSFVETIW
jgi:predicted nucleic acid-binding protein